MKQKLLNSLKALPISQKDKESFIDTISDIAKSNGGEAISFSYFKYPEEYIDYFYVYGIAYGKNEDACYKGIFSFSMYNNHPIEATPQCIAILNDGKDVLFDTGILVNKGESIYDFIRNIGEVGGPSIEEINALILAMKSFEITEEEFYNFN